MQRLFILLSCFIFSTVAAAQTAADSHVQQYTTDNGLPSNGIKGLQWDEKTGFLWMATEAGIVRFNGVDFKSYTKENMPSIASERMLFIARNNSGKIYTADQPGNIFYIDKSKPVLWRPTTIKGSYNNYLRNYYLLGVSDTFFNKLIDSLPTASFSNGGDKIVPVSDTACFILNNGNLFYHSISFNKAQRLPFEKGTVNNFFKIDNSYFITSNKKDIFLLNPYNFTVTPVSFAAAGLDILKTKNNNNLLYWQNGMNSPVFIDDEKAWLLTYDGKAINATLIFTGIPPDSYIKSVQYSEKNRILFIGTESKGLIVINQNRVESKKRNDINSKNRNSYYSQIELLDGSILTNEGDIIGNNTALPGTLPIKGKFSFNISQTNENLLWYTAGNVNVGHNCLHQYNKSTGQTKIYPQIKSGDIVAVSGADIYLANPNGIGILKADSLLYLYNYPKTLAGTVVFDFTEIDPGVLAVATCAGLFRFNTTTNKFDTLFTKENICVRSIWKYKDYVFFGTYGSGFYIYKDGKIKSMPLDKNRYLLYTHCFVPDNNGFCWISTNRGLFKASLSEIINAFEKNTPAVYYHYFGKKDGMEMTELNGGCTPCALRLRNNIISFPTMDGLLWVNPEKAIPVLPEGEIFIDEILVDNIAVNTDSLQYKSLPAQTQEILIELGFSAWCNKENIYLDYQLNDTTTWKAVNTDNETFIRLGGLRSGKYTLRIRKLNGFGKDNYSYKTIQFSITTPWYKQWWFYALIATAILGMFILIYRIRVTQLEINQRKLEKQVAEKTEELLQKNNTLEKNNSINNRLISIISHDIITPLKFLNVAGKNLLEKKSVMPEELKDETIKEITTTSKELQLLSTNILNWIKYQNENRRLVKEQFHLQEMLNQVFSILNSMAHQKNLKLISHIDNAFRVTQYFEALKILIYNLVTNAIHFSENGSIIVNARETEKKVIISVSDEGVGMTAEQIKNIMADQFIVSSANMDNKKGNGLGYLIIKDLLKMMNAQLSINSEKGKGTTVYVELLK
jgi:signal transduction histidine kinase/ligand-binding sensor domain-containing protein